MEILIALNGFVLFEFEKIFLKKMKMLNRYQILRGGAVLAFLAIAFAAGRGWAGESTNLAYLSQSQYFNEKLLWVGDYPPTETENGALVEALQSAVSNKGPSKMQPVEDFISAYPNSPWTPSLRANMAYYYSQRGRYTLALNHWEKAWEATSGFTTGSGKTVGDYTLTYWGKLLCRFCEINQLESLFAVTQDRSFEKANWQQEWIKVHHAVKFMEEHPESAYRCGISALLRFAKALPNADQQMGDLTTIPAPGSGFSMSSLVDLAGQHHLTLKAVQRASGDDLVVPALVHLRENHYVAITAFKDGLYLVEDPSARHPMWLTREAINEEASGVFLILGSENPTGWRSLSNDELNLIYGKGEDNISPPTSPPPCPDDSQDCKTCRPGGPPPPTPPPGNTGTTGCKTCAQSAASNADGVGMPTWSVSEPYISLWLQDRPMSYRTSLGTEFALKMFYHQRETRPLESDIFSFGLFWNCNWLCYLEVASSSDDDPNFSYYEATLYGSGGGERYYFANANDNRNLTAKDSCLDYNSNTSFGRLVDENGKLIGFQETYPNGSQAVYKCLLAHGANVRAFLTARVDPTGRTTQFNYTTNNGVVLLSSIVDCDGRNNWVCYGDARFSSQVTAITNAYGDSVRFEYDANGMMTKLIDVVGITNMFQYADPGDIVNPPLAHKVLSTLKTPYGTTTFNYLTPNQDLVQIDSSDNGGVNRAIWVTQPDGGTHLFVYRDNSDWIGYNYPDIPSGVPVVGHEEQPWEPPFDGVCNHNMHYRNSFYWGPRQYSLLKTTDITKLSVNDYKQGRLRNWLHSAFVPEGEGAVSQTLNLECDPSPDGSTQGQKTWYGYTGRTILYSVEGTNSQPAYVAKVLPNGDTQYTYKEYDRFGNVTKDVSTYSGVTGTSLRTNIYIYDVTGVDLVESIGPDGVNATYGYNGNHQVLLMTNAVGDVTTNTYNANQQVTSIKYPTGLVTTNIYSNNLLIITYDFAVVNGTTTYFRTNLYTYDKGLVQTHTDERGLTVTNSYDALGRLTGVTFPDSTTTSNLYTIAIAYPNGTAGLMILDRTASKDRLGKWTYYSYDSMRRVTSVTDPLTYTTQYGYCTCGSLEWVVDALNNTNSYIYDNAGRRTMVNYPDGSTLQYNYNLLGQVTNVTDSAGVSTTNWYNNQSLLYASSNAFKQVFVRNYDINDRVTNSVDANGVATFTAYDLLGRVLARTAPDAGTELFEYSPAGLIAYTNQLGYKTSYDYDAARRKVAETDANNQITRYGYNAAGDLVSLTDGNNNPIQWYYDIYGRVTSKVDATGATILTYQYDANGRLTNRLSSAKGKTQYSYDDVGNLKTVQYTNGITLCYAYDAMRRLTNMSDAVGTTVFGYNSLGYLVTEDGPWGNDTVSCIYTNRLLASLSFLATQQGGGTTILNHFYGYDAASRLSTIIVPAGNFTYSYNGGLGGNASSSALVGNMALGSGAFVTNTFDDNGRLTSTFLENSGNVTLAYEGYGYNVASQRTNSVRRGDSLSSTTYSYDPIGQVTADVASEISGTPRLNEQRGYSYDAAGNLKYRTNNALVQYFGVNSLNELTTATNGGRLTVAGSISSQASSVTVNATNATLYTDNTFAATNMPNATTYTALAQDASGRQATATANVSLPASENYQYDGNGNLLSDGSRTFTYDCENQLISVIGTNGTPWKSDFAYDGKMRRRVRTEATWNGSAWVTNQIVHYIYSGNLVIQERDGNNVAQATYIRGKDLSGSWEGAGGIGGLLARIDSSSTNYYHSDGNGNITTLTDGKQTVVARYLYDAFGNLISKSGAFADINLYLFSSKEWHQNSGLAYYLYRYYDPNLQRWLNRDPLGDAEFPRERRLQNSKVYSHVEYWEDENLYRFVHNDSIDFRDDFGLCRDCSAEAIACNQECMKKRSPFETSDDSSKVNKWKRVIYCETKCQAEYMACEAANAAEAGGNAMKAALQYCAQHPGVCVGGVIAGYALGAWIMGAGAGVAAAF